MAGGIQIDADFSGLNKLLKQLEANYYVDIGILGEGAESEDGELNVAGIAAVHEFGSITQKIPERSFIRLGLTYRQKNLQKAAEAVWVQALEGQNIKLIFQRIGIAGEESIKEAYETEGFGTWQGFSDNYTTRPSGKPVDESSKLLQDTGGMMNATTSAVGQGGGD